MSGGREPVAGRDEIVHIGGYTAPSGGRGTGIVAARREPRTGELTSLGTVAVTDSPSFLARHPTRPVLYAVNELPEGRVSAWRVETDGDLASIGSWPTGGAEPCHLAVAPDGGHLFVANYGGGSVTVFPLDAEGCPASAPTWWSTRGTGPTPNARSGRTLTWSRRARARRRCWLSTSVPTRSTGTTSTPPPGDWFRAHLGCVPRPGWGPDTWPGTPTGGAATSQASWTARCSPTS
ncbi:hypothetical protein GCM10029963_60860 [Micromonospora andamanensis]